MTTLEDVKDVPMMVRIAETNFYLREVPFSGQVKKRYIIILDFEKLVSHARFNHYCISFLECPYKLNKQDLLTHFDWFSRYLYFNFENSVLLFEIFPYLDSLSREQLVYLESLLQQFPQAYEYDLNNADHRQKWALLKNSKFQRYEDFLRIREADKEQRRLLRERLQTLLQHDMKPAEARDEEKPAAPAKRREREASLYTYLKLSDDIPANKTQEVIGHLYDLLEECFRRPYSREEFATIFNEEESPELELVRRPNFDNQHYKVLFQELKNSGVLIVSWSVIDKKVSVFNVDGKPFSGFSELSSGKIDDKKTNRIKKLLKPLIDMLDKQLPVLKRK